MSARRSSILVALCWSVLTVASAIGLGFVIATGVPPYGVTAAGLFGLLLGAIGVVRHATGRLAPSAARIAGLCRQDVAFAGSFSIVAAAGYCIY